MLQIILFIIGVVGLIKQKIKISSKRQISGAPVVALSCFYLLTGVVTLFFKFNLIAVGVVGAVTLLVVVFVKGESVTA